MNGDLVTVYHGTAASLAPSIRERGLSAPADATMLEVIARYYVLRWTAFSLGPLASPELAQREPLGALVSARVDRDDLRADDGSDPRAEAYVVAAGIPAAQIAAVDLLPVPKLAEPGALDRWAAHEQERNRLSRANLARMAVAVDPLASLDARLVAYVLLDFARSGSVLHGFDHWQRVAHNGMQLCAVTPGADRRVVLLFALLHDSQRWSDDRDPDHGERACDYFRHLVEDTDFLDELTAAERGQLAYALTHHDAGTISDDPTIGACFDADRLELARCGIVPNPALMSTARGRRQAEAAPAYENPQDVGSIRPQSSAAGRSAPARGARP